MQKLQTLKRGMVFLGLALVVSLFAAATANAGIVRGDGIDGLRPVDSWSWYYSEEEGKWTGGSSNNGGGGQSGGENRYKVFADAGEKSLTLWGNGETAAQLEKGGYAFSISLKDADADYTTTFLNSLKVSVNGDGVSVLPQAGGFEDGNYFYFGGLLGDGDEWNIEFTFSNPGNKAYEVALYELGDGAVAPSPAPEPATLALLGLGLAGLGLVRCRRK